MKKFIVVFISLTLLVCLVGLKAQIVEKKEIKLLDSQVEVVDIKENREVESLISETQALMEETCKLHQLLIKEKSNEQRKSNTSRATERRNTHRRRNGYNCPASSSSYPASK